MSSGVSDRSKRQPAVKRMDERDPIPWSQQVDEDLCAENSSYPTENKSDSRNKLRQSFERIDLMRNNDNYNAEKLNMLNVSYNPKRDNYNNYPLKMSSEEAQKPYFGDTCVRVEDSHKKGNDSPDKNSFMSNESNKKKITWASIASQPAKPNKRNNIALKKKGPGMPPPPMIPGKHALNVNPWDLARNSSSAESCGFIPNFIPPIETEQTPPEEDLAAKWKPQNKEQHSDFSRKQQPNTYYNKPVKNTKSYNSSVEILVDRSIVPKHQEEQNQNIKQTNVSNIHSVKENFQSEPSARSSVTDTSTVLKSECSQQPCTPDLSEIVLKQLKDRNNYNPSEMDMQNAALTRYFVIKSYSEDDIHRSIKYEIWCSTDHGNKKLDEAFKERMKEGGNVMLFFSVNGSGHFCGMAQMMTSVDYKSTASVWSQDKWKGKFKVKWIYVKDVPNSQLRHIRLENNDNKSVTNSRDTQEIPLSQGLQMLKILHLYKHLTSIFDDFYHYERKQEESVSKKPTHFDNHVHSLPSSNVCHSDNKEPYNDWHTGHFKERSMFHRGEHSNTNRNRRYGKPMEQLRRNTDVQEKPTGYISHDKQNNEDSKHILEKHSNPSIENCGSKSNYKDIILHVNINCNENSAVRENMHTK